MGHGTYTETNDDQVNLAGRSSCAVRSSDSGFDFDREREWVARNNGGRSSIQGTAGLEVRGGRAIEGAVGINSRGLVMGRRFGFRPVGALGGGLVDWRIGWRDRPTRAP